MIQIELSEAEAAALREVLRSYLSDLHTEIAHTDTYDYRERLKERQALLKALQQRLPNTSGATAE